MKFRYYITNPFNGNIEGTNDKEVAESLAESEDYFVVDAEAGKWLTPGRVQTSVVEYGE